MSRSRDIANMASRHADNKTGLIAFFAQATAPETRPRNIALLGCIKM